MDLGIRAALGTAIENQLPTSWLGRPDVPFTPPSWATIGKLSNTQVRNLQAQVAYNLSFWELNKTGPGNLLGRYQFAPSELEFYGLLATGSNAAYGNDCVNYINCWRPTVYNNIINAYQNYFYNTTSLNSFLTSQAAQDHLSYQKLVDTYLALLQNGAIVETDSSEVVAGMIYVGWTLGAGIPGGNDGGGTGAWAWRYFNRGQGTNSFNSGRYSVTILS
jgi:hypothetical protein